MDNAPNRKNWLERNPKKIIGVIVLLAIGCLAVVTEKLLALKTHDLINPVGIKRSIKLREFNPLYRDVLVPDPDAMRMSDGLVQKPYVIRVDRQGFIMPSKVHDRPDLTIVFLGGSTTECIYVDEDDRFPYLVGRLLERQTHLKVNSYNAARSGNQHPALPEYSAEQSREPQARHRRPDGKHQRPGHPDVRKDLLEHQSLPVAHPGKAADFQDRGPGPAPDLLSGPGPHHSQPLPGIEENLSFAGKPKGDEFRGVRGQKITIDQDLLVREFSLNLQTFINICRARGITPVLMTQASRFTDHPDPLIKKMMQNWKSARGLPMGNSRPPLTGSIRPSGTWAPKTRCW